MFVRVHRLRAWLAATLVCLLFLSGLIAWPGAIAVHAAGGCSLSRRGLVLDPEEVDLLRRLNDYRARNGVSVLVVSPSLTAAAAWKSADLGVNAYFAHDDLGRSWYQRIRDCGYTATVNISENLAAGNDDGAATFEQWRTSSGHNANMLSPAMRVVGIARAYAPGSPFSWYWTADFGAIADSGAAPASASVRTSPTADRAVASSGPLAVSATAVVSGTDDCLRVHDAPLVSATVTACLPDGAAMVVTAGPVGADGYTWWRLGAIGWVVGQYLSPLQ